MLIEPFILRRIKEDVLTELPDKTITILNNEMEEEQEKIYMSYMTQVKEEIETIRDAIDGHTLKVIIETCYLTDDEIDKEFNEAYESEFMEGEDE